VELSSNENVQFWIGAEPFEGRRAQRVWTEGRFPLTVRVEVSAGEAPVLKAELTKPAGSVAQFVVVNGQ
jgi:hypothetical protein